MTSAPKPLAKHPARKLVLVWIGLGLVTLGLTPYFLLADLAVAAGLTFPFGLFFFHQGRLAWRRLPALPHVNLSAQHLTRGAFDEMRAELAKVSPSARKDTMVGRACLQQEALIALYEGRLAEAETLATSVLAMRRSFFNADYELAYDASAHAARGLARVARGDNAGAKTDADAAEASRWAGPEVVARARLVKAVVTSRAAYHEEALRTYLVGNAQLVLEHGMPRERMLFRALRRMSRSPARSVYREPAVATDDGARSKAQSWIAAIAPEAASFTSGDRMLADTVEEASIESVAPSDMNAIHKARHRVAGSKTPNRTVRIAGLWLVLVAAFLAIWQLLTPAGYVPAPVPVVEHSLVSSLVTAAISAIGFSGLMMLILWRARRSNRAYLDARRRVTLGDVDGAALALLALSTGRAVLTGASAHLELARIASRAGDFARAIMHTDAGIARVSKGQGRALAVDLVLPSLMMESAVAMAARGGVEEAAAEIALLERDFPTFSQLALAQLRVRLMIAIRTDRARSRQLAKGRTAEMRMPYREDMLADLVLATHGDLDEQDLERVDAELADDAALRVWIDRVAPGLRSDRPLAARSRVATAAPPMELIEVHEEDDAHAEDAIAPVAMRAR